MEISFFMVSGVEIDGGLRAAVPFSRNGDSLCLVGLLDVNALQIAVVGTFESLLDRNMKTCGHAERLLVFAEIVSIALLKKKTGLSFSPRGIHEFDNGLSGNGIGWLFVARPMYPCRPSTDQELQVIG